MNLWKTVLVGLSLSTVVVYGAEQHKDFRNSEEYKALSMEDKKSLEQVDRDLVLLWGALDMYAEEHDHQVPASLDDLVPRYLLELPSDPYATKKSATESDMGHYTKSKKGFGYRYEPGPGDAFIVASVGLKDFPYVGGNGLYRVRGTNFSGFWVGIGR